MKHILRLLGSAFLGATLLSACDSVSEPDRFIPAEIVPQRAVLVEEFTGQLCTNCPDGHVAIKSILATLGDSVVPVSIHASSLALPPDRGGYLTEAGEEYYKAVGSPALPTAVIDKVTEPLIVTDWGSAINHLIMEATPFTVIAKADFSSDGSNYDIKVDFSAGEEFSGKLMVWILENNLIGRQLDHGVNVRDYQHNHVFRAAVTKDIWGDEVDLKAHDPQSKTYSYPLQADWNKDNLYVVAFLYNDGGVAQVTATPAAH